MAGNLREKIKQDRSKTSQSKPVVKPAVKKSGEVPLLIEPYGYGTDKKHASKYDKAKWREWAKETGFKPTATTVAGQNKEFQDYLLKDDRFKDKVKQIHTDLGMPYAGTESDSYLGERWDKVLEKLTAKEEEETPTTVVPTAITTEKTSNENPVIAEHTQPGIPTNTRAPWWIQDILKEGYAAGNLLNQQAFYPWQAPSNVYLPDMTFYDPERELAANAETTRIGAEQAAAFADPQAFAANFAGIQGAATKNAADILGRYNNLNVGIANQQEAQNAGLLTQASQRKAQEQTSLWDKYQTVNQNLFNSKKAATQQLVDQTAKGITNAANTYNLNQMYPNYAIDPWSGGQFHFQNPKEMRPGQHISTAMEKYQKMLKDNPTFDNEKGRQQLLDILKLDMGLPTGNMDEYERAQLNKGVTPGYGG